MTQFYKLFFHVPLVRLSCGRGKRKAGIGKIEGGSGAAANGPNNYLQITRKVAENTL
ncbi:hypothetical protein GCM10007866_00380 [Gluconobacter albidus]|uniref:Uncharacterized protein n=1 Tax=Gluconobacter albidus TaxID=318683 RepID=A0ABQ5WVK8_9PROT|nr:hypothetical protein GCM10007866_00380 [Gluconobacter albidus]